ncbi:MAG: hypothetical protein ACI9OE_002506, partial [Mariniflexile sp.]
VKPILDSIPNLFNNGLIAWSNGACSLKTKSEPPLFTQLYKLFFSSVLCWAKFIMFRLPFRL